MNDRSVCSVCWCAYAYASPDCECGCHKGKKMGKYIKPSTDKAYVWVVWTFKNFDTEGRRDIHSIHNSRQGAVRAEGLLPRNDEQYYSIEKVELQ